MVFRLKCFCCLLYQNDLRDREKQIPGTRPGMFPENLIEAGLCKKSDKFTQKTFFFSKTLFFFQERPCYIAEMGVNYRIGTLNTQKLTNKKV